MTLNNPNINIVNDNMYTQFGLNLSIRSQDIEQKPNSDNNKGRYSVANLQKMILYNSNTDLVNDNVYKKMVKFSGPFIFKILSKN